MLEFLPRRLTVAMLAAGALGACSLTPELVRPEPPVAAVYPAESGGQAATSLGWREFFPDRRLQTLIAAALENNRDLRTAALRIEEARALYNIQSADLLPNLGVGASAAQSRTPAGLSPTGAAVIGRSYQVGLSLASFELDFFGRVRSLNQAALNQYLATDEARQAIQISLVAQVANAYLAERAFAEQLGLAQRTLDSRETAYKLANQRFEVGASSALDLRQNEVLVQSARVSLLTLARQRAQAENALTLLVGKPLTDLPPAQTLSAQNLVTDIPAGLPSDLIARRPDIRAAEQRLQSANANIGAARAAFFPRISLTAGVGTASTALSGLFDAGTFTWSFVPQLVLPIFDAGRNRANLDITQVRKDVAVADYEKTIQVAFREVADALVARGALDQQIAAQQAVQAAQAERLRLADLRFQNGIASSLEVLDAQRELFTAEQSLVQTRLLRLTNAIDLYRALGGGLNETVSLTSTNR
ncbi:MAG: efflux transporter outer rane subunit [Herminiimonas sp.]|nr:efflux transporter outer rane subunit [Herminiimonas sp.]